PPRAAFFGATGTGKSKLFSSLLGRAVSDSGFRRPFTRQARYYVHEDWRAIVSTLEGDVVTHADPKWREFVLIDTPDFDSVEIQNRAEADRVLAEADGFVFVTDSLKYADASTWDYLRAIHQAGKEFLVVLNKVHSDAIVPSFLARYQATVARRDDPDEVLPTPIVVPEFRIDDATLIDAGEPSLKALDHAVRNMALAAGPTTMVRLFGQEWDRLLQAAESCLTLAERQAAAAIAVRKSLDRRLAESEQQLQERLKTSLEPGMRDEVFQRVLTRIESLDVLRYPRRILSFPARALRQVIGGWWSSSRAKQAPLSQDKDWDPSSLETFQLLEAEVLQCANQMRIDILSQPGYER
ncbi:MAG TPA: GTPase, partial [Pirellulaceae bacterium]